MISLISRTPRQIVSFAVENSKSAVEIQSIIDKAPVAWQYNTDGYVGYMDVIFPGYHRRNIDYKKHLLYFQFDVLKSIANVLVKFDGMKIKNCESLFRKELTDRTGMPFAPEHYTVLRNYKRVFECSFLATVMDDRLIVTDFASELAKNNGNFNNVDDFLLNYINRFRFPFPAFDGYDNIKPRIYPFCAIIKYLIALHKSNQVAKISLDDIFYYIIANNYTGYEDINFYKKLTPKSIFIDNTEKRQLREMIIFISQLSILKVYDGSLWLDIANDTAINELIDRFLTPLGEPPCSTRFDEFILQTKISNHIILPTVEIFTSDVSDIEFIEGKRKRVEHFRVDRSPLLRKYYIEQNNRPICRMCNMDISQK